jgi:hypothetical protein
MGECKTKRPLKTLLLWIPIIPGVKVFFMQMKIKKLLGTQSYWTINKSLVKDIGIIPTCLLQHFIDLEEEVLGEDFWQKQDRLSEELNLSEYEIRKATKVLVDKEFIKVAKKGMPAKNHYAIQSETIMTYLTTSGQKFTPQVVENLNDIKENKEKRINTTTPKRKTKRKIDPQHLQAVDEFLNGNLNRWCDLLALWKTEERYLDSTRKKYWSSIPVEQQEDVLQFLRSIGTETSFLSTVWIATTLKSNNFNREWLAQKIQGEKEFAAKKERKTDLQKSGYGRNNFD